MTTKAPLPIPPGYDPNDRPGWIPAWIDEYWDPDPLAYQTEEELEVTGGIPHNMLLHTLAEMFRPLMARLGLQLLIDNFLLYRNSGGVRQRIGPDLAVVPPLAYDRKRRTYNLDREPPPRFVLEIVSPGSHAKDLEDNPHLYSWLGIYEYLALDETDSEGVSRDQIGVTLWRMDDGNVYSVVAPDTEGFVEIETLGVRLRCDGRDVVIQELATSTFLRSSLELVAALDEAEQRAETAEQEAARLREQLARLRDEQS